MSGRRMREGEASVSRTDELGRKVLVGVLWLVLGLGVLRILATAVFIWLDLAS